MAFTIKYHRLFEVRILHSFGLKEGDAFFDLSSADQTQSLVDHNYQMTNWLDIQPTADCQRLLGKHRLRFKKSPLGFFVGVETRKSDSKVYPAIPIDAGTIFNFKIKAISPDWSNVTSLGLRPDLSANYFFSNYINTANQTAPSLAQSPQNFNILRSYEMGNLVKTGNAVFEAKSNTSGITALGNLDIWQPITDHTWVNSQDQCLVPLKFRYHFKVNAGVSINHATFQLLALDNTLIRSITKSMVPPMQSCLVDFTDNHSVLEGRYLLKVSSTDGFEATHPLQIDPKLYNRSDFGVISIAHQSNLSAFRLLEFDGALRSTNAEIQTPIFEIRFKSRATYWQYIQHASDNYTLPDGNGEYALVNRNIVAQQPQPLNRFYVEKILPSTNQKLPNPEAYNVQLDASKTKYISAIYLPKLGLS